MDDDELNFFDSIGGNIEAARNTESEIGEHIEEENNEENTEENSQNKD